MTDRDTAASPQTERVASSPRKNRGFRLRTMNAVMVLLAAAVAIVFLQVVSETNNAYLALESASNKYVLCETAASDMKAGSNYLTIQVRSYVATQDPEYLLNYFREAEETRRREHAVETFESLEKNLPALRLALEESNALMQLEYYAMELVTRAMGYTYPVRDHLPQVELTAEDAALSPEAMIDRAIDIVFGEEYMDAVSRIEGNVAAAKEQLQQQIDVLQAENQTTLRGLLTRQRVFAIMLFAVLLGMAIINVVFLLWPLRMYGERILSNDTLPRTGAAELRNIADAYNVIYAENMKSHDILRRKAEHDPLTGLYNRGVFEQLMAYQTADPFGLMIVDMDHFKEINDTFGHDTGDAMLKKLANLLTGLFRTTDYPCRLGGDEFVVFMTGMTADLRHVVETKVEQLRAGLADTSDGLPAATVSIGVAFEDGTSTGTEAFKHADTALYRVKQAGRNDVAFY